MQGGLELLQDPIAVRLLGSTELARLAYNAKDGTPRILPMLFHWTGQEVVFGAYAGSAKLGSLRANPDVAITIDTAGPPPDVLLLRGRAELGGVGGIVAEYAAAHRRKAPEMWKRWLRTVFAWCASRYGLPGSVRWISRPGCRDGCHEVPAGARSRGRRLVLEPGRAVARISRP